MKLLFLMILFHLIDDFTLQPVILSKLKQKKFWDNYSYLYKNDYRMALFEHSLEWSIMIMIPVLFLSEISDLNLVLLIIGNTVFHYIIDDLKANKLKINLIYDQVFHFIQIFISWILII